MNRWLIRFDSQYDDDDQWTSINSIRHCIRRERERERENI